MTASRPTEIVNRPTHDRRDCPVCSPRPDRLREDQVWGVCPTNRPHQHAQVSP